MQQSRLDASPDAAGSVTPAGTEEFRVLATCTYFAPGFRAGGPGRSVAHILDTASSAVSAVLVTRDRDLGAASPYPGLSGRWSSRGRARVFYLSPTSPRQWFALWSQLRRTRFDLLYVNSLWAPFSLLPVAAVRWGLLRADRVLVAPRGECSRGALSLRALRKRLFVAGWRRVLRRLDAWFHASTEREAADIRRMFPWATVRVNGNQSALPPEPAPVPPPHDGPLRLVFLGRIAEMKNLGLALAALATVRSPVTMDVCGPIEDAAYWRRCTAQIAALPPTVQVRYVGVVPPSEVPAVLAEHDALVMPTLGENFGHVIAESLAAACPVLCSDRTPWTPVLLVGGCAVVPELTAPAWAAEIERWAERSADERYVARRAAADAYRRWRAGVTDETILDAVRREVAAA
ncbi:glycosyltransferase family 4 protein [Micromonospora musae]|uniref:glycosyltransferase family 4 protein n=1 Tax=Micromonospora musae TaxID=1894970 RepID=UPI0033F0CC51